MKTHLSFLFAVLLSALTANATLTTYTFVGADWSSKVGTVAVGSTDGWVANVVAADYSAGRNTPQGPTGWGVKVTSNAAYKNAGATSVLAFEDIRRLTFNYCTNTSAGKGTLYVQIGDAEPIATTIDRPEKGKGDLNRDLEIDMQGKVLTGKIRFWIDCTENSIYINTITIRAKTGSPNIAGLTSEMFRLVTDVNQLEDSDEVIIGVAGTQHNYIMGLYDEYNSRNNIYALRATYSSDRQSVNPQEDAVYLLRKGQSDAGDYFTFADLDGYVLVASGGNPNHSENNYLTIWDTIYSAQYGYYGAWTIAVEPTGEAAIVNLGKSRSGKLQFNLNGNTPIFSCYKDFSQTMPAIYRKVTVTDPTEPYISLSSGNMGSFLLESEPLVGEFMVQVNTVNLTEDLSVALADGETFALGATVVDRDGDVLRLSYSFSEPGEYRDTLTLSNSEVSASLVLIAHVDRRLTISEAVQLSDLKSCYLQEVVVTKKYDKYIFVQDATGSMLLFDSGNLYGKGCKRGDVLSGVAGRYKNYYGNPEIALSQAFSSRAGQAPEPRILTAVPDSADVCEYVRFEEVVYDDETNIVIGGQKLPVYDLFNYQSKASVVAGRLYNIEGLVYYYNRVVFCPAVIEPADDTAVSNTTAPQVYYAEGKVICPDSMPFAVYSSDGRLVLVGRGTTEVSGLPAGAYLLYTETSSCRFIISR